MTTPGRTPASERVLKELRRRIARGFYPPNSYLPAERLLAREFNTSRTPVSDALEALSAEGLVEQCRGRGTRILPASERLRNRPIAILHDACARRESWPESFYLIHGAEETFARLGYPYRRVAVQSVGSVPDAGSLVGQYTGVLMVEAVGREELALDLETRQFPLVVANLEIDLAVSGTCVDHYRIFYDATATLLRMGHRRIAFVGRPLERAFYRRAYAGYANALRDAEIQPDEALIGVCEAPSALNAYFAAHRLLALDDPPTAFVAGRDVLAEGVCRAIEEAGKMVGRDISVIGFDDVSWPSDEPFLTTFREPCHEMGAAAAEMLVERIVTGWRPPERRVLDSPLILRRTAGPRVIYPWTKQMAASEATSGTPGPTLLRQPEGVA